MASIKAIRQKIESGIRIDRQDAQELFLHASQNELKELATTVKSRFHDPDIATYLIMAIINYTNVCVAKCDYCSFYRLPHEPDTYLLNLEQLKQRIDKLASFGGTLVAFNGGFHPKLRIHDYADMFQKIRQHYGERFEFFEMTIAEFMFSCKVSKVSYDEGAQILHDFGTRWVTGGGAEILDDNFRRRHSPGKYTTNDYFDAQAALIRNGIQSTATMVIGFDETLDERLNHLESLRGFQDENHQALGSFLCWTYKPYNNELGKQTCQKEIDSVEYLRWLAICRIYLDNFRHIRTSVLTQNENALMGLCYGANDFDLPTEDEVTEKAGATISIQFKQILESARRLGFKPTHRQPFGTLKPGASVGQSKQVSINADL